MVTQTHREKRQHTHTHTHTHRERERDNWAWSDGSYSAVIDSLDTSRFKLVDTSDGKSPFSDLPAAAGI